jgi:hypothetical protein
MRFSKVEGGTRSLAAAPFGPDTRPRLPVSARLVLSVFWSEMIAGSDESNTRRSVVISKATALDAPVLWKPNYEEMRGNS